MKLNMKRYKVFIFLCCTIYLMVGGIARDGFARQSRFISIVLGTAGGLTEANLSSYLLAPSGSTDFVALDAGTLLTGLRKAKMKGSLNDIIIPPDITLDLEGHVLHHHVKAYLISHAHLDHLAGLVINSPDDNRKHILALAPTINNVRDHLFNWKIWPNFGDEGHGFHLKKYHYVRLSAGEEHPIEGTLMRVIPFELCHSGVISTAFLMYSNGYYILYLGDTGPDEIEKCDKLKQVWQYITPLVRGGKLCGIFLEISYPDPRDTKQLYGHLTPVWIMKELQRLAELVSPQEPTEALKGLKVVATHIKPSLNPKMSNRDKIIKQVEELNQLGIKFIFPEQGDRIEF